MRETFSKKFKSTTGGYTIIETMIAIALFVIVVTSGMGALLSANAAHQKAQNLRSIMDSLSFIVEDISRNARTGYNYHCFTTGDVIPSSSSPIPSTPKSCANGWGIAFESDLGSKTNNDDQWVYYINGGKLYKSTTGPYAQGNFIQMNPNEVVIDSISGFSVLGAEAPPTNRQQPMLMIRISGTITYKNVITPFSLQTSASQRFIDI